MLIRVIIRFVLLALIIGLVAGIVPGIDVNGGFWSLLWIAVLFSAVNLILGPLFHLFGFPLVVLTLGLFLLVINAGLLAITAGLTSHLDIDDFWAALLGGLLIAIFSWVAELFIPLNPRSRRS